MLNFVCGDESVGAEEYERMQAKEVIKGQVTWCVVWFLSTLVKDNLEARARTKRQNRFWESWAPAVWWLFRKVHCHVVAVSAIAMLLWWWVWWHTLSVQSGFFLQFHWRAALWRQMELQRPWAWSPIRWMWWLTIIITVIFYLQCCLGASLIALFLWVAAWWTMGVIRFLSVATTKMMNLHVESDTDIKACLNALTQICGRASIIMIWSMILKMKWILHRCLQEHLDPWDVLAHYCATCLYQMLLGNFESWWFEIINNEGEVMQCYIIFS